MCAKSFKRTRDLMSHIKIMHKNISNRDRKDQEALIDIHSNSLKSGRILANQSNPYQTSTASEQHIKTRVCFVCSKIFREITTNESNNQANHNNATTSNSVTTSNLNKTFIRHMQIQHGLNEHGERLIECPVCEKNFFNQQQMERHMHTHEVWVDATVSVDKDINVVASALQEAVSTIVCSFGQKLVLFFIQY